MKKVGLGYLLVSLGCTCGFLKVRRRGVGGGGGVSGFSSCNGVLIIP